MDPIVHFELPAKELQRAQAFYQKTFGWNIAQAPIPGMEYYMLTTTKSDDKGMPQTPGSINGGMMKIDPKDMHQTPVVVIKVESIEAAIKNIEANGGKIIMPTTQVGDMGLYVRFTDPEANVMALWQDLKKA